MKKVLIPIANGSEEIETSSIFSVLTRAGNSVKLASINQQLENYITLSRGIKIIPDILLSKEDHKKYDMIIMPGGVNGAKAYNRSNLLISILKERKKHRRYYAAMCATPSLFLAPNQLLIKKATGYPIFKNQMIQLGYQYVNKNVVIDNNIITGQGPKNAIEFSLKIVEILNGIRLAFATPPLFG